MSHPDGLLTTAQVAELTGRNHTTISMWARTGALPYAERTTSYGRVRFLFRPLDVVLAMVEKDDRCQKMHHRRQPRKGQTEEAYEELCRLVEERSRPEALPSWWFSEVARAQGFRLKDLLKGAE